MNINMVRLSVILFFFRQKTPAKPLSSNQASKLSLNLFSYI